MNVKEQYSKETKKKLKESFSISNEMAIPKISKVVVNSGFGSLLTDEKARENLLTNLTKITGQKPALRKAKKAIASFKIRQGQAIGASVTLRQKKMYDFLDKLVSIVLPRVRDFRGVGENSFDQKGNYSLGFRELNVFPEIEYNKQEKPVGVEITIVTTAIDKNQGKALLEGVGIPFRKARN